MSTRCTVHFHYGDQVKPDAIIYRHSDGYPGEGEEYGVLPDLQRFFDDVENQTKDTRFNDPSYLAAKFVVWEAAYIRNPRSWSTLMDFLGTGVVMEDPGDIEYRYHVWCNTDLIGGARPKVTWEDA